AYDDARRFTLLATEDLREDLNWMTAFPLAQCGNQVSDRLLEIAEIVSSGNHLEDRLAVFLRCLLEAQEFGVGLRPRQPSPAEQIGTYSRQANRTDAWINPAPGIHSVSPAL